ncbi:MULTISPECIES: hypothetical protein [Agrobacterium]|jgi:hypothetical protein|uniref:hypothetical protein n=1 Tax=Agrobacterium tumefaciens TaxID=358 RepID=UPI0013A70BF8|nr:hypothetical protein [Agrobacterium tumefaciens]MEA1843498.1 hypothetical protein [Agrobacterium tumefaciens]NSY72348.1 hypothetical protein [Agrobacterium tumefaciens]NSZ71664.1 hypothetical protein [Agrobacterium tumefaciens]WCK22385.1 hypothetical protein G6M09_025000 [Agrobacterium tumefaciens]
MIFVNRNGETPNPVPIIARCPADAINGLNSVKSGIDPVNAGLIARCLIGILNEVRYAVEMTSSCRFKRHLSSITGEIS